MVGHGLYGGRATSYSYSYSYSHGTNSTGQIQMLGSVVNSDNAINVSASIGGDRWELPYGTPVRAGGNYTW